MAEIHDAFLASVVRGRQHKWPFDLTEEAHDQILDRIRFHGVASFISEHALQDCSWPNALKELIQEETRLQAFWEVSHRALLVQIYGILETKGIEALVMKGTALAYSLYADPAWRRRGDTDLLVRERQLNEAREVMRTVGLVRRHDPHGLFFQETWLFDTGIGIIHAIDLHWQPNDSPALQSVLRIDEFFDAVEPLPRLAHHAAAPDRVLTFLQGMLNQAWHAAHGYFVDGVRVEGQGRLIWAWDNHLLAESFGETEWHRLVQISTDRGIAAFALKALQLCQERYATMVPATVIRDLSAAPQKTKMVQRVIENYQISALLIDLQSLRSLRDKASFLLGHVLLSGEHLREKYPQSSTWPLSFLQVRRLSEVVGRWFKARAK